ncbi:LysR substrate-binding domain-containing protein [Undibacterium terreum]|uniref:LysR family transcriptional regulator n=1 Tax=Undibacterium terreum TaxID=1224302 RepID=A0A916V167_9BURK|nr:LysR substrate-binding domain-containing protein [Undibacterium terreum]GGD00556.1 LysR family transcriptional regulator [Undibacterium terreum]
MIEGLTITMDIQDLNNMRLFAAVVSHGSYTSAATELGLQTSKLSRRVTALEQELGVRLLNRTSRRLSLTDAGKMFHRHCVALVAEAQAAKLAIDQTRASPQGVVRISCPPGLLHGQVSPILSQYMIDNPAVRIVLDATNRRVDVVEEGFDISIRVRLLPLEDSDLAMLPLAKSHRILVSAPSLIATQQVPTTLDELRLFPTLATAHASERYQWHFLAPQPISFEHTPRLATDDLATLRDAALRGAGIAQMPKELVQDDLNKGTLIQVLPELTTPEGSVHAIFPSRRGMVPAVRSLLNALATGFTASSSTDQN